MPFSQMDIFLQSCGSSLYYSDPQTVAYHHWELVESFRDPLAEEHAIELPPGKPGRVATVLGDGYLLILFIDQAASCSTHTRSLPPKESPEYIHKAFSLSCRQAYDRYDAYGGPL